jgi:hypothetical protein
MEGTLISTASSSFLLGGKTCQMPSSEMICLVSVMPKNVESERFVLFWGNSLKIICPLLWWEKKISEINKVR